MKLIHCSDLHLDSPMNTHLNGVQARERNAEICHNFGRMVDYAIKEGVQGILIAGDLFDSRRVTARTGSFVLDQIRRAGEIPFFYLRGNHDEDRQGFQGELLPANLKTFSSSWKQWRLKAEPDGNGPDVVIAGIEPEEGDDSYYEQLKLPEDSLNIVMLHGQVSSQAGKDLVCLPRLKDQGIDYLALGHLHSFQQAALDQTGIYCYPGCLEGRGWDECGPKGFVELEYKHQQLCTRFHPWAGRELHSIEIDITELSTITQIRQAMLEASEGIAASSLVRFELVGSYTLDSQKDLLYLKKGLEDRYYYVELKDRSHLAIDHKDYAYDISLKGAFIRSVMNADYSEDEQEAIIRLGMAALQGEELP